LKTVKEVAELTGVSVRTLQYYDEIGVFQPTKVTDAGYRLYDERSLHTLQQILFFKELDFSLKEIKTIMGTPDFDKIEAYKKQKVLLTAKRDRLNRLLDLLGRLEKGEACMSFKEFDLSEYVQALEEFRDENTDEVIKHWGSVEQFNQFIRRVQEHEESIAQSAIEYYGSVEAYVTAMKENLTHFSENVEKMQGFIEKGYVEENRRLMQCLVEDVSRDPASKQVQEIVGELVNLVQEEDRLKMNMGEHYWDQLIDVYLHNQMLIEAIDKQYGTGASQFIGKALEHYFSEEKDK
jgi:DNA-binding transcriptional MerR regulator